MTLAQQTYVPDDTFEGYLENYGAGNGIIDDYVYTAKIDTITILYLNGANVFDLTGIEDFTSLTFFQCAYNGITTLDVSQNINLQVLDCNHIGITAINLSNNINLIYLDVANTFLTTLDVSNNPALHTLSCGDNDYLTSLDVRNGNNTNLGAFGCSYNPNLYCINVDDSSYSITNWIGYGFEFDYTPHYFSNNCSGTDVEEHSTNKELLRTIDILGRETTNNPLFYIYDDGTVEKRITID
jgi:hypothetical protein